jgi:SAM-dependent methyltransferase
MRRMYDAWYRWGTPPWVGGPRSELVDLVTTGRLKPCRVLDLGCGVGDNAIFLAEHGFEVTGADFAPSAIARARGKAATAGVAVEFLVDDLTNPHALRGPYDLLVDYGTLDDLDAPGRDAYMRSVVRLAGPGARFMLWCFEWKLSRRERLLMRVLPTGGLAMAPGEVAQRFGGTFEIERLAGETGLRGWPRGWAAYLMTARYDPR